MSSYTTESDNSVLLCQISELDPELKFARTGDTGFLWPVPAEGLEMQSLLLGSSNIPTGWEELVFQGLPYQMALFVVGSLLEDMEIDGCTFCPIDLETTIESSHSGIVSGSRYLIFL